MQVGFRQALAALLPHLQGGASLSLFLSFLHTSWRKQSLTQEVDLCDLGAFLSAPTSRKMCNTQSVQDDQQFQIVPLAICLSSFWSSYEYHILY